MTPSFSFLFALFVSLLLLGEPFVLRADWSSFGTWFWFGLGVVGLAGVAREHWHRRAARPGTPKP